MAAAAPFVPMMLGAGVGAAMNRDNPLAGAALGALGGAVAGPALGAMGAAGGAGAGAGAAGAYGAALAPAGVGAQQAAMLAAQTEGMAGGLAHTLGSFGASAQPGLAGLGAGSMMSPGNLATNGMRMLGGMGQQPQQMPRRAPAMPMQRPQAPAGSFASMSPYARRGGLIG